MNRHRHGQEDPGGRSTPAHGYGHGGGNGRVEGHALPGEHAEILDSVDAIIWRGEPETFRFTFVSRQAESLLGYPVERWMEDPGFWPSRIHPEDREWVVAYCKKTTEEKKSHSFEYRMISADGRVVWLRDVVHVAVEGGVPRQLFGVMVDITGRKEAEVALRQSEARFRAVFDKSAVGMALVDDEGRIIEGNRALHEMLGYEMDDLYGVHFADITHPEDVAEDTRLFEKLLAGEMDHFHLEKRYVRVDGEIMWGLLTVSVMGSGDDRPGVVVGMVEDITASKLAEGRIREAEEKYRTLVEQIPVVTYIDRADGSDEPVYTSPRIREMLGYTPEEWLEGRLWPERLHPEDRERVLAADELFEAGGESFDEEYRLFHKDGRVVWVREEAVPVRDQEGNLLYWQGVFLDVTKRKGTEAALQESEKRYRAQSRELDLLHQVRTVLARELDLPSVFRKVVEAIVEMYGYTQVSAYLLEGDELVLQHQVGYRHVIERIPLTDGVSGRAVRTGQSILIQDVREDPDFLGAIEGIVSEICVPLFDGGEAVGFINVESTSGVGLTPNDLKLMEAVGEHTSMTISRARLHTGIREREARFRAMTQGSSDIITLIGADGYIRYQSPSSERILGHRPEEMVGNCAFDYIHPDDEQRTRRAFADGLEDPDMRPVVEYRFRGKNGSWRWIESVVTNLIGDPDVGACVVNSRDVTRRRQTEERLRQSEERYRNMVEEQTDLVCRFLPDLTLTYVNDAYCRYFGEEAENLIGMSFMRHIPEEDHHAYEGSLSRLNPEDPSRMVEHRVFAPGDEVRWQQWVDRAIFDERGNTIEYQSVGRDVTERKALEEELKHRAFHDPLTNLPNRRLFVDRLGQALRRIRRRKERRVAVLFMDLDGFKVVNDSLGHQSGDLLLVDVARRLRRCVRPEDTLARFGGDEFVVLIEDVDGPEDAIQVAERISAEFGKPFVMDGKELFTSASMGVAFGGAHQKPAQDLLRDADTAMYQAKEEGLDYSIFDPAMYERAVERLNLVNELRRAMDREEFVVRYQPIVNLESGEACGVEALVRWLHPTRGLLDPSEFVPVVEDSGLVVPMGNHVLEKACRQAVEWESVAGSQRIPSPTLSVNLSARQLRRPDLIQTIERVLRETGFDANRLILDITETVYVKFLEENAPILKRLKEMGIRISIDDFGVGYSSLSYLKRLPADVLKIDKAFITGLVEDAGDAAIVEMIIGLAHTLEMEVVAEGIETASQADLLREMGCDMGQGFYFSEALPSESAAGFLDG